MIADEWPIGAGNGIRQEKSACAPGHDRLRTARADFFLPAGGRLTEQERSLMTAMLHCLVGDVADALRAALPRTAANDAASPSVIEPLIAAGLLDRAELVRLLLRRADEERVATAARARSGYRDGRTLQMLVSHGSASVAAAAMSLIIARGKRRDRFGQCLLHLDDLPRHDAEVLIGSVAAALRPELTGRTSPADRALADAVTQVVHSHDRSASLESLSAALVSRLNDEAELSDERIVAAAADGELLLVACALAVRAGLRPSVAFDEVSCSDPSRLVMLLRMADVSRQSAAEFLAGVGDLLGIADPGQVIVDFEQLAPDQVEDARAWLAADACYRRAVLALAG